MITPRSSPKKTKSSREEARSPQAWETQSRSGQFNSPTFSELMPKYQAYLTDSFSSNLAERRRMMAPSPIKTNTVQHHLRRVQMESLPDSISPLSPDRCSSSYTMEADEASLYSPASRTTAHPEPLDVRRSHGLGRSKSTAEGLRQHHDIREHELQMPRMAPPQVNTPLFSPLQFYFRGDGFPTVKRGEKTMIGDNGWLERTEKVPDQHKKATQKKASILDNIKKIAKDMVREGLVCKKNRERADCDKAELHYPNRRSQHLSKDAVNSRVAISLDPREQSLVYCELEFHLSNVLNDYITIQLGKGRLVPDKLKKVADVWQQKGRPKVVGFRYDLETQLELVNLHIEDFRFYGRRQGDPLEIAGLLHAMKVNARAMSVRTFCQPDPVIAKQLVDAQSLFKMLNVPDGQQIALAEIAQFFKVIVERELNQKEHESRKVHATTHGQGEHIWQSRPKLRNGDQLDVAHGRLSDVEYPVYSQ